MSKWIEEKNRK